MPETPLIGRRGFLLRLLTAAGALTAGGATHSLGGAGHPSAGDLAPAFEHLLAMASELELDREGIAELLAEYAQPAVTSRDRARSLAAELFGDAQRRATLAEVRSVLAQRITADFAEQRTELAAGWLLSRSEIHFLALAVDSRRLR